MRDGRGRTSSSGTSPGSGATTAGLCGRCRHARTVDSHRGSRFFLCERSRTDHRYARYPTLPVWRCPGFEAVDE